MAELRHSLRLRLLAAFVIVAALAVASFAGLTLWASSGELHDLVRRQQEATVQDASSALADAYREAGTFAAADLRPAQTVAVAAGALLQVRDAQGRVVEQPGVPPGLWQATVSERFRGGAVRRSAIVVAGERVGTVALRFPRDGLPPPERRLRSALLRTAAFGALIAAAVAVAAGMLVGGRLLRPLRRLAAAVERIRHGERSARAAIAAPGELGQLGEAIDSMAADLEREDELRRQLVADVSHELRTPITILTAELERLVDGAVEPRPERLVSLHEEALRLARSVEDVETLADAGAASLTVDRRPVRLDEVVAAVADSLRPQVDGGLRLELSLRPVVVDGDADRLAQVVRNLLANAVKFTPRGGRIGVSLALDGRDAVLVVEDSGLGIAPDELPHVFERFWRGRAAGGVAGRGVGLAVVDQLVRAHGGRVTATSDGERGSTFSVSLPDAHEASVVHDAFTPSPHAGG